MSEDFHVEIDCQQICKHGKFIFGDVFYSKKIHEENRTLLILADGMGSGVKANVLATLTASMAINFTMAHKNIVEAAEIIMSTLPICSVRKISYCTFTIVDIESDGTTRIVEYDNPKTLVLRGNLPLDIQWQESDLLLEYHQEKKLRSCTFKAYKEDRIIFWSDGIMQSGLGSDQYPQGWQYVNAEKLVKQIISSDPKISARQLAKKLVNKALSNDMLIHEGSKDDISCAAVYFRNPRHLLICSGPPFESSRDFQMAMTVSEFAGKKIVCGGTSSEIIARELHLKIDPVMKKTDPDLPPISFIPGMDLVTEGVLTLNKVIIILEKLPDYDLAQGPADTIVKMIMDSDVIHFLIGTGVNVTNHDPNLPMELELRRTMIKQIVKLLEDKFLKEVEINYM